MDILKKVRESIAVMRKYKEDNRLIDELKVSVSSDVLEALMRTGELTMNIVGRFFLDNVPVVELKDWPEGFISVE